MLLIFRRWRSSAPWHQQFWFLDASADVRFLIDLALWCAVLGLPWDLPRSTKFKVLISTVCSLMVCIHLPKAKPSLKNGFQISTWSSLGAIQPLLRGGGGEFDSFRWKQIRFLSHIGCVALITLTAEATTNGTLQDIARQRHLRMGAMEAMLQEHPLRTSWARFAWEARDRNHAWQGWRISSFVFCGPLTKNNVAPSHCSETVWKLFRPA